MKLILAAVFGLAFVPSCASADGLVGHYTVKGTNPGGDGSYSGTVNVVKTGDTYKVTWKVGGDTYVGTGIGDDSFVAVSYASGKSTGIALFGHKKNDWQGVWTYASGKTIGTEVWSSDDD